MFKTNKNRRVATALISVVIWIFGNGAGSGMVFCMAGSTHTAIEPTHYGMHKSGCNTSDDDSSSLPHSASSIVQTSRDSVPCTDIPPLGPVFGRPNSEHPTFLNLASTVLPAAGFDKVSPWIAAALPIHPWPSMSISYDSRLKTTILLIWSFKAATLQHDTLAVGGEMDLSVPASVGFIALFGIALENGMVLVTYLNQLLEDGVDLDEASVKGACLRLRPVLMTAITTALGLIPLLFSSGTGSEVQRPLATVVTGGLVTSTALTLLVLPAVYKWFAIPVQREVSALS